MMVKVIKGWRISSSSELIRDVMAGEIPAWMHDPQHPPAPWRIESGAKLRRYMEARLFGLQVGDERVWDPARPHPDGRRLSSTLVAAAETFDEDQAARLLCEPPEILGWLIEALEEVGLDYFNEVDHRAGRPTGARFRVRSGGAQ